MKITGILLMIGAIVYGGVCIWSGVRANYEWSTQYGSSWELGIKASTIEQKSEYVDKFVSSLEKSNLQGSYNVRWYKTPNNSFDENFKSLQSLQKRLKDIKKMKTDSFEYQTAIQQITAQEQDEAQEMLSVLKGCWFKIHHPFLWSGWFLLLSVIGVLIAFFIGLALAFEQ